MWDLLILYVQGALALRAARVDWFCHRLPNQLTGAIALFGGIGYWLRVEEWGALWLLVVGLHLFLVLASDQGLGAGDLKLIAGLAPVVIVHDLLWLWLLLSYLLGAGQAIVRFRMANGRIPFGPALIAGWWLVLVGDFAHASLANCR